MDRVKKLIADDGFYKSSNWLHKRKQVLERDNYECQRCKSKGGFSPATCVHHIKHLKDRPDLALEEDNLVGLCDACHNLEHPEKLLTPSVNIKSQLFPERW